METYIEKLTKLFGHLLEPPLLYAVVGGLVVLVLLYLVYVYQRSNRGIVPFKTQGGNIEIAPHTLRSVIQQAANTVEGVEKASCRHFVKGRRVGVKVAIHLQANSRLKDVETRIKQCIRATLHEQFGMENIEPIHIRVTRMVGDPVAVTKDGYAEAYRDRQAALMDEDDSGEDERPYSEETRL